MRKPGTFCACGQPKHADEIVCKKCWNLTEIELRRQLWNSPTGEVRTAITSRLVTEAAARKPEGTAVATQTELFPS